MRARSVPADESDLALGASYRLVARIGRGSTGEVWRGVDRRTGATIAAKLLRLEHVEDDELVERFLRERSILTGLRHENVVAVRDLVVEGDRLAIVMDFVAGGSLRDALRSSGPLPPALAVALTASVLDGLAAAHQRRVLHRDVKPDNVLLADDWRDLGPGAVQLSDFGISRIVAEGGSSSTGLVGTPEYMAPEQLVTGAGDLPADVYGAGVLLYELLAGRTPFAGAGTGYAIAHRHVTNLPPRLPVPDDLWGLLASLLDKDPTRRPTAVVAAARLRALAVEAGLPALPRHEAPASLALAQGPATEVRGLVVPADGAPPDAPPDSDPATPAEDLPDLGTSGQATMLRAMPVLPPAPVVPSSEPAPDVTARPRWRDPRVIVSVVVGVLLIAGGVFWILQTSSGDPDGDVVAASSVQAHLESPVRPTGLGIDRDVTFDPQTRTAQVVITYSAQRSPLEGPFLEVLPGLPDAAGCPAVEWSGAPARLNAPSVTGIDVPCSWAVTAPRVPAQQSVTVTAAVLLPLPAVDPETALQTWLAAVGAGTETATTDGQVTSTAYAAQRLSDVQVVAPTGTVSGRTLKISLVPVWPSGADGLNPMFVSPPTGRPSSILVAVAGGTSGVRFSDGCSGALSVSADGLVVSASSVATECQVNARVGNFTDLASNPFAVATRGS